MSFPIGIFQLPPLDQPGLTKQQQADLRLLHEAQERVKSKATDMPLYLDLARPLRTTTPRRPRGTSLSKRHATESYGPRPKSAKEKTTVNHVVSNEARVAHFMRWRQRQLGADMDQT
jgi:hypothetical protein